jgi:hypothetical protein
MAAAALDDAEPLPQAVQNQISNGYLRDAQPRLESCGRWRWGHRRFWGKEIRLGERLDGW